MVVPDEQSFTCVFVAHRIARDGLGHDAGIGKRKILGDYAAPPVGAEFDGSHDPRLYAKGEKLQQAALDGSLVEQSCPKSACLRRRPLQQIFAFIVFQPFHDLADVLRAVARANEQGVWRFHHDQVTDADGGYEFCGAPEEIALRVDGVTSNCAVCLLYTSRCV